MSENTAVKKTAAKKTAAPRKPRATKKAAAEAPVEIENVVIEEASTVTEEGQKVITGPKKPRAARVSNMHSKEENKTVSSRAADSALKKKTPPKEEEKSADDRVALWSSRNVRWTGIGTLSKGYNIVTKEAAEKWLGRQGVRAATPEELATHYGK